MIHLLQTELKKLRHRHIGLIYLGAWLLIFLWLFYTTGRMDQDVVALQGYSALLLSLSLVNCIILPTLLACVQSRLCDIELKGNTYKQLCTLQPRRSIYHIKMLVGTFYLLLFSLAETMFFPLLGCRYHISQPAPTIQIALFLLSTFVISLVLCIFQQSLSLLSSNQLFPLFFGVGGTFIGIFSAFFPGTPIPYLFPWGYYVVTSTANVSYDQASRIANYYLVPFPWGWFAGYILFGILVYLAGKNQFMKKEV